MKKAKISCIDFISLRALDNVKEYMSVNEIDEMNKKMDQITGCLMLKFSSYEACLLAKKMFEFGYLAAHTEYEKQENETKD